MISGSLQELFWMLLDWYTGGVSRKARLGAVATGVPSGQGFATADLRQAIVAGWEDGSLAVCPSWSTYMVSNGELSAI